MISIPFLLPIISCWTRDQITITITDHGKSPRRATPPMSCRQLCNECQKYGTIKETSQDVGGYDLGVANVGARAQARCLPWSGIGQLGERPAFWTPSRSHRGCPEIPYIDQKRQDRSERPAFDRRGSPTLYFIWMKCWASLWLSTASITGWPFWMIEIE